MEEILRDILMARRSAADTARRIEIFRELRVLRAGIRQGKSAIESKDAVKLWGYKINGHDYNHLNYLNSEIFLSCSYYFETDNPSPIIIDCGANIGFSVLYFKKLFPASRIYAFEPNPHSFAMLEKNVRNNAVQDITLYNAALSDTDGSVTFYFDKNNPGTLLGSLDKGRGGSSSIEVKAMKLSNFIRQLQLEIDLIKIDVEGAEVNIVRDLVQAEVFNNVKMLIVEYHHKINQERGRLSGFLKTFEERGFDYNVRGEFTKQGEFQDLVIHFYR